MDETPSPRSRLRVALLNAALIGFSLFVGFVLIEVALRVYNPFQSRVKHDKIVLPANETIERPGQGFRDIDETVRTTRNSIGFRGPELPDDDDTLRVFFVGGSTTESAFTSDGKTWIDRVEELLGGHLRGFWFNNAGLDGHSTFGHGALLDGAIAALEPDYVVFLIGTNDVGNERPRAYDREQVASGLDLSSPKAVIKSIVPHSEIMAIVLNAYRAQRARNMGLAHKSVDVAALPPAGETVDARALLADHADRLLPAYRERVGDLMARTRALGATPVLMTQPLVVGGGLDPRTGADLGTVEVDIYEPGISGATAWALLESYNDVVRSLAEQEDVPLIDLGRLLPKDSTHFTDYIHFTNTGSAAVGDIVAAGLCPVFAGAHPERVLVACAGSAATTDAPPSGGPPED